jgi:hypothetical protein
MTKLSEEIKSKISNTLKGKIVSETKRINHILGSNKKNIFFVMIGTQKNF